MRSVGSVWFARPGDEESPMFPLSRLIAAAMLALAGATSASAECRDPAKALGVARTLEIDGSNGPVYGRLTALSRQPSFLERKEVVLTFDDGPKPGVTGPILDALDRFCTKATFFAIGRMAVTYPETLREVHRRGHTLAAHTWSHPNNLRRVSAAAARDQIERGFAAVTLAAGVPVAPFFRFPGLSDSADLVAYLGTRGTVTFTVDVVSNDSYIASPDRLIERTLKQLDEQGGGIMLFHDIKPQTARALPAILAAMKQRGYRVVHIVAKQPFSVDERYVETVREYVASRNTVAARLLLASAPPRQSTVAGTSAASSLATTSAPSESGAAESGVVHAAVAPPVAEAVTTGPSLKRKVESRSRTAAPAKRSGIATSTGPSRSPLASLQRPADWRDAVAGRSNAYGN
jgi:peptidoglycan-N-acetylglucosamine deacetylase